MAADALGVADRSLPTVSPAGRPESKPTGGTRLARSIALSVGVLCAIALLFPVLASPLNADDRYWYLLIGARADGSVLEVLAWTWEHVTYEVQAGRLASLAGLERRLAGMGVIEAAVATSTPLVVYQALVKLTLFAGGILSCLAFVRSLRQRDQDGRLVRASTSTFWLTGIAGMLALAAGAQAHSQFRNGWTSYPVFTYSAVIFIFGSVALLLWLSRLVAERSTPMAVLAVVVLLVLAVATNLSYELIYPAVPVAAVALAVTPVTDRTRQAVGRRAKLLTGAAYLGGFTVVFVAIRLYLADLCSTSDCYTGVQIHLGERVLRTAIINLVTAVPGFGNTELRADLDAVGLADRYPVGPGTWSVAVGSAVIAVLLIIWWATSRNQATVRVDAADTALASNRRIEARLLIVGAGLCLLVAFGTAAIMSLSIQAQQVITAPGQPYRNTMVTWMALAFGAVLMTRGLTLILPRRVSLIAWTALALVVGTLAALTLPNNLMALRASRIGLAATEAVNWEVVQGDVTSGSDARRCDLFERLKDEPIADRARTAIYQNANAAFEHYHGQPFCSDYSYPAAG